MLKSLFGISLATIAICNMAAQDNSDLYRNITPGVVYLVHEIIFEASNSDCQDLWLKFEAITHTKLMGGSIPMVSGSGFFIDNEGTALTNHHVAKPGNLDILRENTTKHYAEQIDKIPANQLNAADGARLKKDLKKQMAKGEYHFNAYQNEKLLGDVSIKAMSTWDGPDLAIVQIPRGTYKRLKLAPAQRIDNSLVGTPTFSLGYPLGFLMDETFSQRVVTMNQGTVSAFRADPLNLQHTSAISGGNSGGPLVDSNGEVLGINTATSIEKRGNSLFYAIGVDKIRAFLELKGYKDLVFRNALPQADDFNNSGIKTNANGEVECASAVIIDTEKGAEVLLDGLSVGKAPLVLTLTRGLSKLVIRGNFVHYEATLRLMQNQSGTTTLRPAQNSKIIKPASPTFTSTPSGAEVFINGNSIGRTPCSIELAEGNYAVRYRMAGFDFPDQSLDIGAAESHEVTAIGSVAYPVTLTGIDLPATLKIVFSAANHSRLVHPGEPIELAKGDWSASIQGSPDFMDTALPFSVGDSALRLDLSQLRKTSVLEIHKLPTESRVWVDGKEVLGFAGNSIPVPTGKHSLYIWHEGNAPFEDLSLMNSDSRKPFITYNAGISHGVRADWYIAIALGVAALSTLITIIDINDNKPVMTGYGTENYLRPFYSGYFDLAAAPGVLTLLIASLVEAINQQVDLDELRKMEGK